ncbi:MAG: Holliday junction resolvase RuvX [Clostridiales Family XIII bacterium]|nr:Holliday junction resolvase RuvX [Clostridiales Family XIII bacterium]
MRVLALDVGDKTIGIALSDELGITAQGLFTLARTSVKRDTDEVLTLVRERGAGRVLVGLPINLDGSDSMQTTKVRDFAQKLENKMRSNGLAGIPVTLHDERFTTKIAERVLIEADMRREKRKGIIDRQAAVVLLQDWLDTNTP